MSNKKRGIRQIKQVAYNLALFRRGTFSHHTFLHPYISTYYMRSFSKTNEGKFTSKGIDNVNASGWIERGEQLQKGSILATGQITETLR